MVMAADTWARLREFAGWIVQKYSMSDNQSDIRVGEIDNGLFPVPSAPSHPSQVQVSASGLRLCGTDSNGSLVVSTSGVYASYIRFRDRYGRDVHHYVLASIAPFTVYWAGGSENSSYGVAPEPTPSNTNQSEFKLEP